MRQIFAASGVNVDITDVDTSEPAIRVYFTSVANAPDASLFGISPAGSKLGYNPNGRSLVYLDPQQIDVEQVAKTAAHEIGHDLGLQHMPGPPWNPDVMTSGQVDRGVLPIFRNGIRTIPGTQSLTQNPQYDLLRYVNGVPDAALQAVGILPGRYDQATAPPTIALALSFNQPNRVLYDVDVLAAAFSLDGSADTDVAARGLAHYTSISLSQLSQTQFELMPGESLQLFAASIVNGDADLALATGDPRETNNLFIVPTTGTTSAQLWMGSSSGVSVVADASIVGVEVPEPQRLWLIGTLLFILRQRHAVL